jgi:hypothetical protein
MKEDKKKIKYMLFDLLRDGSTNNAKFKRIKKIIEE